MNAQLEHRKTLIAALRSGEYEKTTGRFARWMGEGKIAYCMVGVGLKLIPDTVIEMDEYTPGREEDLPVVSIYGRRTKEIVDPGFVDYYGLTHDFWSDLSIKNDGVWERGGTIHYYSFAELADLIEAEA